MIRTLVLAVLLTASAWAESFEEMEKNTDMSNADAVYALAKWCAENRLPSKATQLYAKVVKIDPDHFAARAARGEVLVGDRWVNKAFAPKVAAPAGGTGTGESLEARRSASGPGPAAKDVVWDLTLPKDPNPIPNDFIDGLIERMRAAKNESDAMDRAVATILREDNWATAFPRLCAALAKPGYGDVYGASDILMQLAKAQRVREMRRLFPFIAKASEGVDDAGDLTMFALAAFQLRERKSVPRLIELLGHADTGVQDQARESLAAIVRLPAKELTPEKAKAWWDANWSLGEDQVLLEQLRSSNPAASVEAAAGLAEMRNPEIFMVLFKLLRSDDPAVAKRALDVLRRATGLDWGITPALTPKQRNERIDAVEKWWKEEKSRFSWPGIPVSEENAAAAVVASDPSRDAVQKLASTTGTEAQDAEGQLRTRGRVAVPALLDGLASPNSLIRRRAHDILRETTKQDFKFDPRADEAKRTAALAAWHAWAVAEKIIVEQAAEGEAPPAKDPAPAKP